MRFLKRPETLGSTLSGHIRTYIRHFRGLKTPLLALHKLSSTGTLDFVKAFFVITLPENTIA
jgi:hypothetical protein